MAGRSQAFGSVWLNPVKAVFHCGNLRPARLTAKMALKPIVSGTMEVSHGSNGDFKKERRNPAPPCESRPHVLWTNTEQLRRTTQNKTVNLIKICIKQAFLICRQTTTAAN